MSGTATLTSQRANGVGRVGELTRTFGVRGDRWPYLVVLIAVLLGNILFLTGVTLFDPIVTRSGLAVSIDPGFLPGSASIDPNDGYTSQALGAAAIQQYLNGDIPWWDPYSGLGAPLAGSMQPAALFPLVFLQGLPAGFLIFHVVLDLLGGLAAVKLGKLLGLRTAAVVTMGVLFALNGSMLWFTNAVKVPVAFLPLMLVAVELAVSGGRERSWRGAGTMALSIWLLLSSGFPEGAYLTVLFSIAWLIWRLIRTRGARWQIIARLSAGSVIGLLLAAPALLSFLAYLRTSPFVGGHTGVFANRGLPDGAWGQFFTPYSFGPIFAFGQGNSLMTVIWSNVGGYSTMAVLFLAFVGLIGGHRQRFAGLRLVCAGWSILCAGKVFALPVITPLMNLIPGMDLVAFYRYGQVTWVMAMIVLAALGIDDLVRGAIRWWSLVSAAVGTVVVAWWCFDWGSRVIDSVSPDDERIQPWFAASWVWAGLSVLAVAGASWFALRHRRIGVAAIVGLVLVEAVVMFAVPSLSAPKGWKADSGLVGWLEEQGGKTADGSDLGRIYSPGRALLANYGAYFGVSTVNVVNNPQPALWVQYVGERLDPGNTTGRLRGQSATLLEKLADNVDGYRAAAVEYVLVDRRVKIPPKAAALLTLVQETEKNNIYRLEGSLPYVAAESCTVRARSRVTFEVDCPRPSSLVRRELLFSGWQASVNGEDAPIVAHDGYFQSVAVPEGRSTVEFGYRPFWLVPSLVGFGIALVALLGLAWSVTRSRAKSWSWWPFPDPAGAGPPDSAPEPELDDAPADPGIDPSAPVGADPERTGRGSRDE